MFLPLLRLDGNSYSIKNKVVYWNNVLPFDLWYRRKYNIRWMSEEHLNLTLYQQVFDKIEETVIYESEKRIAEISKNPSGMTDKELDDEFENLNIEDYVNEKANDKI